MGEEHPLTLGAVVARAQVVLGGVAVDLVVDEEVDLVVPNPAARVGVDRHNLALAPAHVGPAEEDGKGVKNGT